MTQDTPGGDEQTANTSAAEAPKKRGRKKPEAPTIAADPQAADGESAAAAEPKRARMSRKKAPDLEGVPKPVAELSRYVSFAQATLDRSAIKNAPYNPRIIDDDARKRLMRELKSHGLVEAVVWNKRTGNLVGGHQRLSILDDLHEGKPYSVPADVIDCDEKEEKRLNVALNSPDMQGRYDGERFNDLVLDLRREDPSFDVTTELGLAEVRLEAEIGLDPALLYPPEEDLTIPEVLDDAEKIREMKKLRRQHKADAREKEAKENARLLVVEIPEDLPIADIHRRRDALLQRLGFPSGHKEALIPAWRIEKALGILRAEDAEVDETED
jgi:hypothetical protein